MVASFRQPFDLLAKTIVIVGHQEAGSTANSAKSEIWLGVLVSTSANPAGCVPARDPARVRAYFNGAIDYFVSGRIGDEAGLSEIRDGVSGRVLRPRHGGSTADGCLGGA